MATFTTNSALNERSRYVQGGTVDEFTRRLGWWERRTFIRRADDFRYTVLPSETRRPDLVARKFYGSESLMWIVLQFNNIVDIEEEFKTGREIMLPTQKRVFEQLVVKSLRRV